MFLEAHILQPLIDVFNDILKWLHNDVGLAWGLGIVLITWLSRVVVLPFTLKSMHGMREMQALQPYLKEIQEKYKDDRQRMQREQMALFQEHGVQPALGLPAAALPVPRLHRSLRAPAEQRVQGRGRQRGLALRLRPHHAPDRCGGRRADRPVGALHLRAALLQSLAHDRRCLAALPDGRGLLPGHRLPDSQRSCRHRRLLHRQRCLADDAAGRDQNRLAAAARCRPRRRFAPPSLRLRLPGSASGDASPSPRA